MRIVVTGGSGFIGTNLISKLLADGIDVLNIDIEKPRDSTQISLWKQVDILDYSSLSSVLMQYAPDYIVHLAARTDLAGKTLQDYDVNIGGVANILRVSKAVTTLRKLIITSSMLVCYPGYIPYHETDYAPSTVYGNSKVQTEELIRSNPPTCDWCIIRPTSIWGPWFAEPYRKFFDMIISGRYFHMGNRGCKKTYGYVENTVYQIKQILFSDTNDFGKVFYVGDYVAVDIESWADEIAQELGRKIGRFPFFLVVIVAYLGDLLSVLGISFPMTSFRLKNMTTDNIINMENTKQIAPELPVSRAAGIKETLKWLQLMSCNN